MADDPLKMNGDYNRTDRTFIRIKDFVIVGGAIWGFVMWSSNFATMPKTVLANTEDITKLQEAKNIYEIRFVNVERDIKEIKDGQNRVEGYIKDAIARRPS